MKTRIAAASISTASPPNIDELHDVQVSDEINAALALK
jgi:hypothetical protein